jgi:hypothetical protein
MLTDADLDAIEARLDAATGEAIEPTTWSGNRWWLVHAEDCRWRKGESGACDCNLDKRRAARNDLIAHAPTDLRALLAAVRRGRRIEAAARRVDAWMAQDRYTQLEKVDGGFDLRAALAEEPEVAE